MYRKHDGVTRYYIGTSGHNLHSGTSTQTSYPGLRDALVFVAPDDQVQKTGQVLRLDGILGAVAMLHTILVQNKDVEPF